MTKNYQQEVEKLRAEIANIQEEREWLSAAAISKEELRARAAECCHALATEFGAARHMGALANPMGGPLELLEMFRLHTRAVFNGAGAAGVAGITIDDVGPLLAWALGDTLIERMHAEIDLLSYVAGPPMAERPARRTALQAELRKFEITEEKLICAAEEAGVLIARRADADPAIVLGYDSAGTMPGETRGARPLTLPPGIIAPLESGAAVSEQPAPPRLMAPA